MFKRSQKPIGSFNDEENNVEGEFKISVLKRLHDFAPNISRRSIPLKNMMGPPKQAMETPTTKTNEIMESVRRCQEAEQQNRYLQERLLSQQNALDRFLHDKLLQAKGQDYPNPSKDNTNTVSRSSDQQRNLQLSGIDQDTAISPRNSERPLSPAA